MFRFKSILSRIAFLHVLAVVITAIFMPLALYWFLRSDVENLRQGGLREQAELFSRHLVRRADGSWSLDLSPGVRDQYSQAYGRYSYAVLDDTGRVLFSSSSGLAPIFPAFDRSSEIAFLETRRGQELISGANFRKSVSGQTVWIQVAENLGHRDVLIDDVVANFIQHVGWITLPILLTLLAADIAIFRRAMQPLLRASDMAAHIGPQRTDVRLPTADIPKEILALVVAINEALDRLESGFRRLGEFTADAAHELRTPLAILRTRIETLPDRVTAQALQRDVEGMTRTVNQLLDAAEVETLAIDPQEECDLHQVCADVAEYIAPLALARGKTIALSGAEGAIFVKGNAEMLRRAIRNLVENALNHTPKGTAIEIVLDEQGIVSVLDEGEGIPAPKHELIFERFWRRNRQPSGGAGLGLSIVKRIVEAHGGSITVENRPVGGANFSIRFELAGPANPPLTEIRALASIEGQAADGLSK